MNLYDQLAALQNIPGAYEKWTGYREAVTHYILEQAYGNRELAILGAGRCNDMDLRLLATYFEKLYLFDQDEQAMKEALKKYGLWEHPRIEMKVASFTGIEEDDLRDYADGLIKEIRRRGMQTEVGELAMVAQDLLNSIEEKLEAFTASFGTYENTVVLGVHSQLLNMLEWIWQVVLQTLGKTEESVRARIIQLNDRTVERFNTALIRATREQMIMGCEESRIGQIGMIQGAYQALSDMEARRKRGDVKVVDEKSLVWSFNEEEMKCYRMKILAIKPSNKVW